ncbi:MAG: hypothetical protein LBQ02_03255 [Candidatus Nomurabacteria bacterium]|nr:hypothetical protein [Candidatus Nomurabacteria bacterium]
MANDKLWIPLITNLNYFNDKNGDSVRRFYEFLGFDISQQVQIDKPHLGVSFGGVCIDMKSATLLRSLPDGWEYRPVAGPGSKKMFFHNGFIVANIMDYQDLPQMKFSSRFMIRPIAQKTPVGTAVLAERYYPKWLIDIYDRLSPVMSMSTVLEYFSFDDDFSKIFQLSIGQFDAAKTKPITSLQPFEPPPADHGEFVETLARMKEEAFKKYRFPDVFSVLGSTHYNEWMKRGL